MTASRRTLTPQNRRETGHDGAIPGGEAHRFKPGESGNPGGRPRTGALARACRAMLERPVPGDRQGRTYAQQIAERLADLALKGHTPSIRELADRAEGRAGQSLEIETRRTDLEDAPLSAFAVEAHGDSTPESQGEALDAAHDSPS